jgi:hypothetical protein
MVKTSLYGCASYGGNSNLFMCIKKSIGLNLSKHEKQCIGLSNFFDILIKHENTVILKVFFHLDNLFYKCTP